MKTTLSEVGDTAGFHWVGPASFEDRCVTSLEELACCSNLISVTLLQYLTKALPVAAAEDRRFQNSKRIREIASKRGIELVEVTIDPYTLSSLVSVLDQLRMRHSDGRIILDLTCLTKVHAISAAYWFSGVPDEDDLICYTVPAQYGRSDPSDERWRDVLVSPIGIGDWDDADETASSFDGILLMGHEGGRMALAVAEATPERGLLVLAHDDDWLGVERQAIVANEELLRRTSLRAAGWPQLQLHRDSLERLFVEVEGYASGVSGRGVMLYPFGPKPFVFVSALAALNVLSPGRVWFSYPVPLTYDAGYSAGARGCSWFRVDGHWKREASSARG